MSDVNAAAERALQRIYNSDAAGIDHSEIYGYSIDKDLVELGRAYLALHPADDGDAIDEAAVVALCCYVVYTNQAIRRDARQLASRILEGIDQGRTPIGTRRVIAKSGLSQL